MAHRSLSTLQRDNRRCRACAEAGYPLESRPVFEGNGDHRAYIYGQAPGVVEGAELRPWRGRAGRALRAWLQMDEDTFYATFYCASVTALLSRPLAGGTRRPNADAARARTLRGLARRGAPPARPRLVVTVGGLAARRVLGIRRLTEAIGERFDLDGVTAIPLPHPSGASGWLNDPANRARLEVAVGLVLAELSTLAVAGTRRAASPPRSA